MKTEKFIEMKKETFFFNGVAKKYDSYARKSSRHVFQFLKLPANGVLIRSADMYCLFVPSVRANPFCLCALTLFVRPLPFDTSEVGCIFFFFFSSSGELEAGCSLKRGKEDT